MTMIPHKTGSFVWDPLLFALNLYHSCAFVTLFKITERMIMALRSAPTERRQAIGFVAKVAIHLKRDTSLVCHSEG